MKKLLLFLTLISTTNLFAISNIQIGNLTSGTNSSDLYFVLYAKDTSSCQMILASVNTQNTYPSEYCILTPTIGTLTLANLSPTSPNTSFPIKYDYWDTEVNSWHNSYYNISSNLYLMNSYTNYIFGSTSEWSRIQWKAQISSTGVWEGNHLGFSNSSSCHGLPDYYSGNSLNAISYLINGVYYFLVS